MKLKILLPTLLLASIFFVQCKKSNDAPLLAAINQTYYVDFNLDVNVPEPTSFSFQKDGKLKLAIPDNTGSYTEFTGTYKINGTNVEINYSLGQKDTTYTITASFSSDYKTFDKGVVMLVKNGSSKNIGNCDGEISFLKDFYGAYYQDNNVTPEGHILPIFKEDYTLEVIINPFEPNPIPCKGTYQFINGKLNGNFKTEDGTLSFSFKDATIKSDGKGADIIEVAKGNLKITLNGKETSGYFQLVPYIVSG